jgi:thioredoxin
MKKSFLTLVAAVMLISASGTQKPEAKPNIVETVVVTTVNSGSERLTKTVFIQKVWNYTQSPKEWKYLGTKPAIVDFYADWCGPCKIAGPILEEVSEEFAGKILVYKVNTDQEQELAQVFGITGIPAFLYIPAKGQPVMMSGIGRSKEETKKMFIDNIEKYLQVKK